MFWVCVIVYCVLREVPVFWSVRDCILCVTGGACVLGCARLYTVCYGRCLCSGVCEIVYCVLRKADVFWGVTVSLCEDTPTFRQHRSKKLPSHSEPSCPRRVTSRQDRVHCVCVGGEPVRVAARGRAELR